MFSSFCISTYGDNRYVNELRILTAIELYLHSDFYYSHPDLLSLSESNPDVFCNIDSIMAVSVSHASIDSLKTKAELVKHEAINICEPYIWSGFLCVLALASVCSSRVQCYYKNIGSEIKYRLMFNKIISPRVLNNSNTKNIDLLFCYSGFTVPIPFKHNHYAPLLFYSGQGKPCLPSGQKRKIDCSKKGKSKKTNAGQSYISNFLIKDSSAVLSSHSSGISTSSVLDSKSSVSLTGNVDHLNTSVVSSVEVDKIKISLPNIVYDSKPSSSLVVHDVKKVGKYGASIVSSIVAPSVVSYKPSVENVSKYDVCTYKQKACRISDVERKDLIKNVFVPETDFIFPKTNSRNFRFSWFKSYPWLCYSPSEEDAAYCLSCVLFGYKFPSKAARVKSLFSQPFKHWPDAIAAFERHCHGKKKKLDPSYKSFQALHTQTWPILDAILTNINGLAEDIDVMVDRNFRKEVEENRRKLEPIVDTVILLGRLGLPFRGHRDDSKYCADVGEYSGGGVGNFVEILNYRVRGGLCLCFVGSLARHWFVHKPVFMCVYVCVL